MAAEMAGQSWRVWVVWEPTPPVANDAVDRVSEGLAEMAAVVAGGPNRHRIEATLTVEADSRDAALQRTLDAVMAIAPGELVASEVEADEP